MSEIRQAAIKFRWIRAAYHTIEQRVRYVGSDPVPSSPVECRMAANTDDQVVECVDMAMRAARKAVAAVSPSEVHFWLKMEQRWVRLARTYRDTAWLGPRAPQIRSSAASTI